MCGFVVAKRPDINQQEFNTRMRAAYQSIHNRGTDGEIYVKAPFNSEFGMAHRVLPLVSESRSRYIQPKVMDQTPFVFAGEIFNFRDFSNEKTDTEFLLELISRQGFSPETQEIFHSFDGFWSMAFIKGGKLTAITDYLCQKPVYYRTDMVAVASEPGALTELGATTEDGVYMSNLQKWGYSPDPRTPWNEIKQIPPGCYYDNGIIREYWNWDIIKKNNRAHVMADNPTEHLSVLLTDAMNLRMKGIGKRGLLLSGGLDSAIVYQAASGFAYEDVTCYHVENNETMYVRSLTRDFKHIKLDGINRETRLRALEAHQTPCDLGSVIPQKLLAEALAKEEIRVCYTGDGADELFGGYRRIAKYDSQMSDIFCELPYYHNPRLDRIMMDSTIELRTPFLAPSIVAFAMELPLPLRTNKKILKMAFRELPDLILDREKQPLKTKAIQNNLLENTQRNITMFRGH